MVSAGLSHTVAVTMSGELFTFGDGSSGQLGHNSSNGELVPRRVEGLPAATVFEYLSNAHGRSGGFSMSSVLAAVCWGGSMDAMEGLPWYLGGVEIVTSYL